MTDVLRELHAWLAARTGVWGGRILAVITVFVVYLLVWWTFGTVQRYTRLAFRPPPGRHRGGIVLAGLIQCGLMIAVLVWFLRAAIEVFPDWLGL